MITEELMERIGDMYSGSGRPVFSVTLKATVFVEWTTWVACADFRQAHDEGISSVCATGKTDTDALLSLLEKVAREQNGEFGVQGASCLEKRAALARERDNA